MPKLMEQNVILTSHDLCHVGLANGAQLGQPRPLGLAGGSGGLKIGLVFANGDLRQTTLVRRLSTCDELVRIHEVGARLDD